MMKDFVAPILVLSLICLVISGALAMMDSVTSPMIGAAAAERTELAMASIIPEATGFERLDNEGFPRVIKEVYRTENNVGYIFIVAVNGFSGDIRIICGVDPGGSIISTSTLQHTETKGIGTILDEPAFLGQFDGKDSRLEGVSTVTGATISTKAFIGAINEVFAAFETVREA